MNYKGCDLRKGLEFILQDLINEEDKSYITIENYQEKIVGWFDEKSDKNEEMTDWFAKQFPKMQKVFKQLGVEE